MENIKAILEGLKDWLSLLGPISAGLVILWKYFLKKKYDQFTEAHKNLAKVVEYLPKIERIEMELKPNGGSSIRDAINRIERKVVFHDQRQLAMIKSLPFGTWLSDENGKCIDLNRTLCMITGRTESQIKGDNWSNWILEKDEVLEEWNRCVTHAMDFDMEYTFIHPNKQQQRVHGIAYQLRDEKGTLIGFLGTLEAIGELK